MIELRTLGAADLRRNGQEVRSVLSQPKRLALLVHLAVGSPSGYHTRESLLGLFWPESDDERARNSLRQALHYLRRSLGPEVIVNRGEREVGVDSGAFICDATAFRDALEAGRLEEALDLYRGDFLPGFRVEDAPELERWVDEVRGELRRRAVGAAAALSEAYEDRGEMAAAVLQARRGCALAPHDEAAARRLIALLARTGEAAAALDAFTELERRLAADFDVVPGPETLALVQTLRRSLEPERGAGPVPGRAPGSVTEPARGPATEPAVEPAEAPAVAAVSGGGPAGDAVPVRPQISGPEPCAKCGGRECACGAGGTAAPDAPRRRLLPAWAATAAALLVLGALAWGVHARMGARPVLAAGPPSLAILPFVNMTGDPAQEYLGDGLTEELLNVMAGVPDLRVTARTSSFAFKGRDVPVDSIGRALGVTHVLEGSVRLAGEEVRVTAQLVETGTGFHLWSRTFEGRLGDLFALQDRMSRAIGRELHLRLVGVQAGSAAETAVPRAYELLLRANQTFRLGGREQYVEAARLLEEAVRLDPRYARARATLANVLMARGQYNQIPRDSAYGRARVLAEEALALRPVPEAHLVLARLANVQGWDTAAAHAHYRQAQALSPGDSRVLQQRGTFLKDIGRFDEAVALLRQAVEVDPLNQGAFSNLGSVLQAADRLEEALAAYRQGLLIAPGDPIILSNLANALGQLGRYDEALAVIDSAYAGDPADEYLLGLRGFLELRAGRMDEAEATLRLLESRPSTSRYRLATLYGIKGDLEKVLDLLEEAVARREEEVLVLRDPSYFPGLRHHPRMIRILERIEGSRVLAPGGAGVHE